MREIAGAWCIVVDGHIIRAVTADLDGPQLLWAAESGSWTSPASWHAGVRVSPA